MPGLLRLDAFNQLERLEDQADQFGIQFKGDIILDKLGYFGGSNLDVRRNGSADCD
jgi:hypothetical protein